MKTLSVIVPCFNEELVINEFYTRVKAVLKSLTNYASEIIFINDGSRDNTPTLLSNIAKSDSTVKVLHFSRNFGHQPAVSAGIHQCKSDFAIIIDADLQDAPELIPDILKLQDTEQANVVYCVREEREGESYFKKQSAKLFYRLFNYMSDARFPLDAGDFRLIDKTVIQEFSKLDERGKYIRGLISWMGFKQIPFSYKREARYAGETKYPLFKMIKFASTAMVYFSKKPLKIATNLGFLVVVVSIILAIYTILGKLIGYTEAISGWTSIMIMIIFFGGIQLLSIGILGQYVGVLFDEIKNRPEYIVAKTENV